MKNKNITKIMITGLLLLVLISSASAGTIFREQGNVGIQIEDIYWKIQKQDYITRLFDFWVNDINGTRYEVFWCWKNLNHKAFLVNCMQKEGAELLACATLIHDRYFPTVNLETFRTHFLDIRENGIPLQSLTGGTQINTNRYLAGNDCGNFYLDTTGEKGEKFKIGYESTIIELTDVDINIMIEPETEECKDGHCTHYISVINDKDNNHCMNSLDMYGEFPAEVSNTNMYYNQPYQDENKTTTWHIWEPFTTQRCIAPHTTGNFKLEYDVPLFSEGKWDFVFWYDGTEYRIDPYYDSKNWAFENTTLYDFNTSLLTVDGNAHLEYDILGKPVFKEVEIGSTASTSLVDLDGSSFSVFATIDTNIFVSLASNAFKTTGGEVDEDINVAILIDGEILQNIQRTVENDYQFGSVFLHGIKMEIPAGEHIIKAQFSGETGANVSLQNTSIIAMSLEENGVTIPHSCKLNVTDTTTNTVFEDIDGSDFNITLNKPSRIFAQLSASIISTSNLTTADLVVSINNQDGNMITRDLKKAGDKGCVGAIYTSEELPAGTYLVKGRWKTSTGTLTGFVNLSAIQMNTNIVTEKVIATDTTTSFVLEDIDGLDININLSEPALVVAYLIVSSKASAANTDINTSISIDGEDAPSIMRWHSLVGLYGAMKNLTSKILDVGNHTIKGRMATSKGTATVSNPLLNVQIYDINYPANENPSITPLYALTDTNTITELTNFIETAYKPAGTEIKYQLTDNNGSTYQYWTGSTWAIADDNHQQANTASDVNINLSSFTVLFPREIKFRAYLNSADGNFTPLLDSIEIEYSAEITNQPPSQPTLIDEPDGQYEGTVFLQWNASTDPESDPITYRLKLGTSSGANDIADVNTTDLNYTTASLTVDTYYWSVLACDDNFACSVFSTEDTFTIVANNPPSQPTLITQPDNKSYIRDFDWLASTDGESDTIRYHINIGTTSGGNDKLDANTFTTDYNSVNLSTAGTYYWRVRACDNYYADGYGNCSNWSSEDIFTVQQNDPPTTPTIFAQPDNNATIRSFDWTTSSDTETDTIRYQIRIGTIPTGNDKLSDTTFTTDYNNFDLEEYGTYYWNIKACDNYYNDGYGNCSSWASEDTFIIFQPPNQPPSKPVLIPETDDQNTIRNFDWLASTDPETDTIRYHINIGTFAGSNNKLDANTFNTDYNNWDMITAGNYHWQVRACDSNSGDWNACSDWATDNFTIYHEGIIIIGYVGDVVPNVVGLNVEPDIVWDGVGTPTVSYLCYDPNGVNDLNRTEIQLIGTNTALITDLNVLNWFVIKDISPYIINTGITIITAKCYDDANNVGASSISFSYSPDHKIDIDYGANVSYDLSVDLNFTVPNDTKYMSFSCDNISWSPWEVYRKKVREFPLKNKPEWGCVAHGEGTYYVYASFSDGIYSYATFDHIEVVAVEEEFTPFVNPNETTETTTALFSLAAAPIEWGLIVLLIILAGVFIFFWIRSKEKGYPQFGRGRWG